MSRRALTLVQEKYPDAFVEQYADRTGGAWGVLKAESLRSVLAHLKDDPQLDFKLFLSMDGVDRLHLPNSEPRYEVVYLIRSLKNFEVARFKVRVGGEAPEVPSISTLFQGANWWERFIWDFYGIRFTGHPDLRRILMYEEFKGHPLRKDYPLRARQPLVPERPIQDLYRGPGTSGV